MHPVGRATMLATTAGVDSSVCMESCDGIASRTEKWTFLWLKGNGQNNRSTALVVVQFVELLWINIGGNLVLCTQAPGLAMKRAYTTSDCFTMCVQVFVNSSKQHMFQT